MSKDIERTKRLEIHVTQRDGSVWAVPLLEVAKRMAAEYDCEVEWVLKRQSAQVIWDWGVNNSEWGDYDRKDLTRKVKGAPQLTLDDFEQAWLGSGKMFDPGETT